MPRLFSVLLLSCKTTCDGSQGMDQSRSPRWVAPGHSRAKATFSSLAFEEAHRAARSRCRPECPSGSGAFQQEAAEEVPHRSARDGFFQFRKDPSSHFEPRSRRHRREGKFGSFTGPRPTSSLCPSSRQAHCRFDGIHRMREKASGRRFRQNSRSREDMRRIHQDELEHAEKELQEVREEAERQKVGVVELNPVAELAAELSRVRAQLVQLQGSRPDPEVACGPNVKRPCLSGQGRVRFPPMPTLVPAELSAWLSERHSDRHDALINGDLGCVPRAHHNVVRRCPNVWWK